MDKMDLIFYLEIIISHLEDSKMDFKTMETLQRYAEFEEKYFYIYSKIRFMKESEALIYLKGIYDCCKFL